MNFAVADEQPHPILPKKNSVLTSKTLEDPALWRAQKFHFCVFNALPIVLTCVAVIFFPPSWVDLSLLLALWVTTALGLTCGYHRHFSHRSFQATKAGRVLLAIMGSLACQGPVITWAAFHRRHHELSDEPGDPHTPNCSGQGPLRIARGFLFTVLTWMWKHPMPNPGVYAVDLMKDRLMTRINKLYYPIVIAGAIFPALVGLGYGLLAGLDPIMTTLSAFLWGWAVRTFVVSSIIGWVNAANHLWGIRSFKTKERSRNIPGLGLLTFGETWHNNHHAFPNSARVGLLPRNIDTGYYFILLLRKLGLVTTIQSPSRERINQRLNLKENS